MRTTSPLQLVIAGATGNVGSALCRTLQQLQPHGVTMRLLANSRRTWSAGETPGAATDWDATRSIDCGIGPKPLGCQSPRGAIEKMESSLHLAA